MTTVFSVLPLWVQPTNKHKAKTKKKNREHWNGPRKLTIEQVREIRRMYKHCEGNYARIAAKIGATPSCVANVLNGITWGWHK